MSVDPSADLRASRRVALALRLALLAIAVIGLTAVLWANGLHHDSTYGDAWNYLAAGERLNAGHPLYALSPGDRPVVLMPPYWSVPLLSPPPIAVVWRPLAALGEASLTIWNVANVLAIAGSVVWLCRSLDVVPLLAVALTSPALGMLAWSGNVNGFVLAGMLVLHARRDVPIVAGTVLALLVGLKITPIFLVVWLIGTRRWAAARWMLAVLVLVVAATVAAAGPASLAEWLAATASSAPSPLSLAHLFGMSPLVVALGLGAFVAAVALRWPERGAFAVAAVASALASPALYFQALAVLCGAAAPWSSGRALSQAGWAAPTKPVPGLVPATSRPEQPGAGSG